LLGRGGGKTGDGPRRHTRAAAAVACRPARGGARRGDTRAGSVEWMLGKVLRVLAGDRIEGKVEFNGGDHGGLWRTGRRAGRRLCARGGATGPL
jgi:hypothetical protein